MQLIQRAARRALSLSVKKQLGALLFALVGILTVLAALSHNLWALLSLLVFMGILTAVALIKVDFYFQRVRSASSVVRPDSQQNQSQRIGALQSWGRRSNIPTSKFVQRLTTLRTVDGRDVLVSSATAGRWSWSDMAAALEMYRLGGEARLQVLHVLETSRRFSLLHLADVCFRQNLLSDDLLNAATLYRYVYDREGYEPYLKKRRGEFFLDSLIRTGQIEEALQLKGIYDSGVISADDAQLFLANAENLFLSGSSWDAAGWLQKVNRVYERAGLARLALEEGTSAAFLRLTAEAPQAVTGGPLVSIIMPVYNADEFTDRAISSALNQSYRNLEVIIVDDGSDQESRQRLQKWDDADPRVRVILNNSNAGAYTSRNTGFAEASGEYTTIFDGDDWQHPQKIELLVAAAMKENGRRLVTSPWTRADENLFFHYRGWRGAFITPAHVSTMFHTSTVRTKLGYWDSVRKAADTEFLLRYRILVNADEPLEVSAAPLTVSLVGSSNLSIEDFRLGYRSPDRIAYRDSYEHWHEQLRSGHESGMLNFPQTCRAFPAPQRFLPQGNRNEVDLDVLFVADFGAGLQQPPGLHEHLSAALSKDLKVGLMHYPSLISSGGVSSKFSDDHMNLFALGRAYRVEITDRVRSNIVNVHGCGSFQYTRQYESQQSAQRIIVWLDQPPYDPASGNHFYEIATIERNIIATFNGPLTWVALNEESMKGLLLSGGNARADSSQQLLASRLRSTAHNADGTSDLLIESDSFLPASMGIKMALGSDTHD